MSNILLGFIQSKDQVMRNITLTIIGMLISIASFAQVGAITGVMSLCTGTSTVLSDTSAGGVWSSSNPAVATIGSSSGILTGVSAGVVTITYSTGSFATAMVTVNPMPAPIVSPATLCVGTSGSATDAISGGTWTSSNTSVATIGMTTGLISGTGVGVSGITYSLPGGCSASSNITVNATPSAISGPSTACTGNTITLSSSPGGGTWTSSLPGVATVGSTGIVTGVTAGSTNISYTLVTGCYAMTNVSVNPSPGPVSGPTAICSLSTGIYSDPTSGGAWASSNPTVISINSLGTATGNTPGTATIFYSVSGCSSSRAVTVNALPATYPMTGGGNYCSGGAGSLVNLGGSQPSISYQLLVGGTPTGPTVTGTGAAITFGYQTITGTYTSTATNPSTGCISNMTGTASVGTNPLPSVYTLTTPDGTSFCAGGTGFHIGLSSSSTSINYEVFIGGTGSGVTLAGTGSSLDFGTFTTGGTYSIKATNPITGCVNLMSGTPTIVINPLPASQTVSGGGSYCSGGTGAHIYLNSSNTGIDYQLFVGSTATGSAVSGTGGMLDFGPYTIAGTYTVVATNATTGCTQNMSGSATISMNPLPALYTVSGGGTLCSGGTGFAITLSGSETGVTYELYNGSTSAGSPISGTGGTLNFGVHTAAGTYTVKATYTSTGCTRTMTGSAVITVIPSPTTYAVTGGGSYCSGGGGVPIGLSGSQTGVDYQLYDAGAPWGSAIHGTGGSLIIGMFTAADTYTVKATSMTTGCQIFMSGSAIVTINPLPTICLVTGGGAFCSGGTGVPVGLNTSITGTSYQLKCGSYTMGSPMAGTGSTLDYGLQTTAGVYTVIATNTTTGCMNTMGGTATVAVNPLPLPFSVTGGGSYCSGGTGVHIGLSGSNTGIAYQLYNGVTPAGTPVSGTGSAVDFGPMTAGGTYTAVATNTATTCVNNMPGSATVSITSLVTPTISMSVSPNDTVCAGTLVNFSETSTGGGSSPTYTWFRNGVAVSPTSTYSYVPVDGDIVRVYMTSSAPCASPSIVNDTVTMTVLPSPTVTGTTSACVGSSSLFTGPTSCWWGSSNPAVGVIATIGSTSGVFTGLSAGTTVITCTLAGCTTTTTVTVNALPTISATTGGPSCGGSFTVSATGGDTYSWSPATALSCGTCAITSARPTTTTIYTVTGTDVNGCSDTATITVDGNRISGYISYTGSSSDTFKVWLIQFNPSDSSLIAQDSAYTCMTGGTPYYEFYDKPAGNYMVKAKLMGTIPGTSGYIPTYSLATPYWYAAASIAHGTGSDSLHINMVYGTVPPGPGFIGGLISSGAGKGTSGSTAKGMQVYLKDALTNFVIASTTTDTDGTYSFSNIGYGNYVIYPEAFSYHTTPSAVISLSSGADSATGVNFRAYTTSRVILPITVNSVTNVGPAKGTIDVYPNPATETLHINWRNETAGNATITIADVTGRNVYSNVINMGVTGEASADVSQLKSGIYLMSVRSESMLYSVKVMIQH